MSIVHLGNHHGVFDREPLPNHRSQGVIKDMTLPVDIGKKLVPIFQRRSNPKLLNWCSRSITQNANEALHSILWNIVPKSTHVGRKTMQTAIAFAVCRYAMGASYQSLICKAMQLEPWTVLKETAREKDLKRAEKAVGELAKKRRICLKYSKLKKDETAKKTEDTAYSAGAF